MGMMRQSIQPLTSAERQALLDYLQRYAFQAANPDTLTESQSPAGQTYIDVCSRCHALPDPAAHTSQEWVGLVDRMEINMANMGMGSMEDKQKTEILAYLKEQSPK